MRKLSGILTDMSKHLSSQSCKLEPSSVFSAEVMMQNGPPIHQPDFKQSL